ncbi:TPA: hypothetical protein P0E36_004927 [Vibrio harveyi]|nr:hypothetical protein [Vibrio harveyi]
MDTLTFKRYNNYGGVSVKPPVNPQPPAEESSVSSNHVSVSGGDNAYSDTMAALTRAQYEDYKKRFQPIEKDLVGLAMSDKLYKKQIARNEANAAMNFRQADQRQASASEKYGLSDRRTDQQKTNLANANALSLASANNNSRQAIGDLQLSLMTGGSSAKQQINKLGGA